MTREEAIKLLTQYIDYDAETPDYYKMEEACKVAIKALEQEPSREIEDYENEIEDLHKENKTLQIKLENAEDVLRGIKEDLEDARAELRERW